MYAIVDIAGQQYKVEQAQKLKVHRLEAEEGKHVELDKVLLVSDGKTVNVGTPTVEGFRIAAKVLSHGKGDKVLVFKKKRRKGYQKLNGHRQYLTELWIEAILGKGSLSETQRELAMRIFRRLAEAEAAVHGMPIEKVHFHEVGALDSIADIAGVAIALDVLGIERFTCRSVPTGQGMVKCAHGLMPIPAPGTAALLR